MSKITQVYLSKVEPLTRCPSRKEAISRLDLETFLAIVFESCFCAHHRCPVKQDFWARKQIESLSDHFDQLDLFCRARLIPQRFHLPLKLHGSWTLESQLHLSLPIKSTSLLSLIPALPYFVESLPIAKGDI